MVNIGLRRILVCLVFCFFVPPVAADRFTPVSLTKISDNQYVVADYRKLYLVRNDNDVWTLSEFAIKNGKKKFIGKRFNPAGVYYSPELKTLFIANYNGHNILRASVSTADMTVTILDEIRYRDFISPENIHADSKRKIIAVADYDAQHVFLLNIDGSLIWKRPLKLAHGVFILGEFVYATGLGGEPLVRFGIDGTSRLEMSPTSGTLWYPTQISDYQSPAGSDALLMVIDANFGKIVLFNPELQKLSDFGSNGESRKGFLRPYSALYDPVSERFLVADTFKNRIAIFGHNWKYLSEVGLSIPREMGRHVEYQAGPPYCSSQLITNSLVKLITKYYALPMQSKYFGGYQTLCVKSEQGVNYTVLMPTHFGDHISKDRIHTGFVWSHEVMTNGLHLIVMGSPDSSDLLIYEVALGVLHKAVLPRGVLLWAANEDNATKLVTELAAAEVHKFKSLNDRCASNPLAGFLVKYIPQEVRRKISVEQAIAKMMRWKKKSALIDKWINRQDMEGVFRNWIKEGESMFLEDAILADLMNRNDANSTRDAFNSCR